ncbi:major type 1 subunit fimbrin (pilin) [Serratia fonticola]|uniref:Major type 1 subunit fimbrin (Pilin) n=1 Tax=Serratia fonticola TaxID=47917 RepID=A0A542D0G4_SERFO|nr:fimbrial protein [Serratia fonticola]TQI81409.1 major type 1 subunit fimbrin (pilin) [Serratia fonticola]TQI96567.1 major type 1 subunit fimbrin (pilin) [Serratia fonticola]TVZ71064.1 major type 1 subunit fimbrin (pilin) [Serratia fonticola]
MKKILCVTTLVAAMGLGLSASALADDGIVRFEGQLVSEACQVINNVNNPAQVDLGKVAKTAFPALGATAGAKKFTLALKDCPPTVSTATVAFSGTAANADNTALALTQEAGVATGVGIQISDASQSVLSLGAPSAAYPLLPSVVNNLDFVARYISTADNVTAGPANSVATFDISYQ